MRLAVDDLTYRRKNLYMKKTVVLKGSVYLPDALNRRAGNCNDRLVKRAHSDERRHVVDRTYDRNSVDLGTDYLLAVVKECGDRAKNLLSADVAGNHLPCKTCANYIQTRVISSHFSPLP